MSDFPRNVEEITPEWLTQVLRESGAILDTVSVIAITTNTGEGDARGVTSDVAKLVVDYDFDSGDLPSKMVAKFASSDSKMHSEADRQGMYECEARFYTDLAPGITIRTPRAYFSGFDVRDRKMLILLEDLSGFRSVDVSGDCDREDARAALNQLAAVQTQWWNRPELGDYTWMSQPDLSQDRDQLTERLTGFTARFLTVAGEYVPPGIESIAHAMSTKILDLYGLAMTRQKTIVHGDYRTANLFFDDDSDGKAEVIAFDWQSTGSFGFARDISHFLISSFAVSSRRAIERSLVDEYYEILVEGGVSDLSYAEFEDQIREALLGRMFYRIGGLALGGERMRETEEGRRNLAALCERMQMLIDWNCDEVIPK
jgi:hypothetical protein